MPRYTTMPSSLNYLAACFSCFHILLFWRSRHDILRLLIYASAPGSTLFLFNASIRAPGCLSPLVRQSATPILRVLPDAMRMMIFRRQDQRSAAFAVILQHFQYSVKSDAACSAAGSLDKSSLPPTPYFCLAEHFYRQLSPTSVGRNTVAPVSLLSPIDQMLRYYCDMGICAFSIRIVGKRAERRAMLIFQSV